MGFTVAHASDISRSAITRVTAWPKSTEVSYPESVDISIGIANSPREITFESNQTAAELEQLVASALESEAKFVTLSDVKGRRFVVPTSSITYFEIGSEASRRVGFVA